MSTIETQLSRRLQDAQLPEEWSETFYYLASALLTEIVLASRDDFKALRRLSKIEDVLETGMSPAIERAAEVHAIMHQLRWVTLPANDNLVEEIEDPDSGKLSYIVTEAEFNERVEMIDIDEMSSIDSDCARALKAALGHVDRGLYQEAKKHWSQKATLQSLAVNIYLDRHGHIKENDREQWREKLRRDLREMRSVGLTVVPEHDCSNDCSK